MVVSLNPRLESHEEEEEDPETRTPKPKALNPNPQTKTRSAKDQPVVSLAALPSEVRDPLKSLQTPLDPLGPP